jgi:hypothetical protein
MDSPKCLRLLDKIATVKEAEKGIVVTPTFTDRNNAVRQEAWGDVLRTGLLVGGGAASLRGIQGLFNLIGRAGESDDSIRSGIAPMPVSYPVPRKKEDEEEEEEQEEQELLEEFGKAARLLSKRAQDPSPPSPRSGTKTLAYDKNDFPFYYPGMLLAALGAGYGGWKGMDWLMDKRRQDEVQDELDEAKQDFRQALTSHHTTSRLKEKNAACLLGEELDVLFNRVEHLTSSEKTAQSFSDDPVGTIGRGIGWLGDLPEKSYDWITDPRTKGHGLGLYGTYAIPSLLLGYFAAKGMADKFSKEKLLEEAEKQRAVTRARKRPSELYAIPNPIESDDDDEE